MFRHIPILIVGLLLFITVNAATAFEADGSFSSAHKRVASSGKKSFASYTDKKSAKAAVERIQVQRDGRRISSAGDQTAGKSAGPIQYREASPQWASHDYWFDIYDARVYLSVDYDGDGYYSELVVEFDADTAGGFADVYAEIYLSLAGGAWVHYHTTDVFTIYAGDDSDDYSVSTRLLYDFPTGDYDILIDLYEAGYAGIVASIGPSQDADLYALPLEDREHELGSNDTTIDFVSTELFGDRDHDGFFTELSIAYDISTVTPGVMVYAEVILTHNTELWQSTLETDSFDLHNETELVEIILDDGFDAAWYDIEIHIIDSHTGRILAIAAQDFSPLTAIPLEAIGYDDLQDNPDNDQPYIDGTHSVNSNESGGGSLSLFSLLLGTLIAIRKNLQPGPG